MPDDNRFAGLGEAVDEPSEVDDETDEGTPDTEDAATRDDDQGGPAFEFEETTAKSIYIREETLQTLEDTEFEVESLLRREHGLRDSTGREFHDAAVRVLAEHVDDIAKEVLAARGEGDDTESDD